MISALHTRGPLVYVYAFKGTDVDAGVDKGGPCVQVTSILPLYSNTTTKAPDIWIPL